MDNDGIRAERLAEHIWLITLRGEHDLATAARLRGALEDVFAAGSVAIVDLSASSFIDSQVIGVIAGAATRVEAEEEHGLVVVAPPGGEPRRVLDVVDLGRFVRVVDTREAALAARNDT
jgi:anti-anti-sigma factor